MPKILVPASALVLAALLMASAGAGPKMKRLGEDATGDGPPALDITYLDVGRADKNLDIRIGISGMLPVVGGYPQAPGIEWVFEVGGRTFIAEAVADRTPAFYLFEQTDKGFQQLESPTGTYDSNDGFIKILVPLKNIGARSGSRIAGVDAFDVGGDVDAHVHHAGTSYADFMATEKDFVVP